MKPVAVIGGGITGLTAAWDLKRRGVPVRLFEADDRVGGVIQSIRREGHLVEFGPNSILETSPLIRELVRSLGLENRLIYSDPAAENRYIVRGKKPVAMPSSPLGLLSTPLFSAKAKLRVLAEPFIAPGPPGKDESIGEFVCRRLGQEFLDYAIDPLVAGIYAGDPGKLSVSQAFPKLHALEQRYRSLILGQILGAGARKKSGDVSKKDAKKLSFDEGLQVLINALAEHLSGEISVSNSVDCIERSVGSWMVEVSHGYEKEKVPCSAVVLALPAYRIADLNFRMVPPIENRPLANVYYPPVASMVLGYRRKDVGHPLDGFGMLVPGKEGFSILGALFSSSLFPNRAPEGDVTITCFIGGARAPRLPLQLPRELVEIAHKDLSTLLNIKAEPTFHHVVVYRQAIPQYNVGFQKFRDLMNTMERQAPGLFIAGHARNGISVGDCIVSGAGVASRIQTFLAGAGNPVAAESPILSR